MSNDEKFPPNNGAILTIATIIKAVMSSAAEAELGALFINAKGSRLPTADTRGDGPPPTENTDPN